MQSESIYFSQHKLLESILNYTQLWFIGDFVVNNSDHQKSQEHNY